MSNTPARTRYAPSPTGRTHLGNLRTALFAWAYARHTGGQFLLRIEDTDRERFVEGAQAELMNALRWLGLEWDEGPDKGGAHGPYTQSEKLPRYQAIAQQLVQAGHAYYCDCTEERLEIVRKMQTARSQPPRYDNHCRDRGLSSGLVIRFKMPEGGVTVAEDARRGPIRFENDIVGDPIILKSDGFPTYHLAAVVDDHDMQITHVLRGEEWISSTPIHLRIYEALGWTPPVFAHLPLVTDFEGRKIKKRSEEGAEPDEEYLAYADMLRVATLRERGYLPDAVVNFLAFLGWHPGTTDEILSPADIVARFTLDRLSVSPGVFDVDRLNWFNQQYMKRLSADELAALALPHLRRAYESMQTTALLDDLDWLRLLMDALRDDLIAIADVVPMARFAFIDPTAYTPEALSELRTASAPVVLAALRDALPTEEQITLEQAETLLRDFRDKLKRERQLGGKQVLPPIRAALTGVTGGPHLTHIVALLGPETCRRRIAHARQMVETKA